MTASGETVSGKSGYGGTSVYIAISAPTAIRVAHPYPSREASTISEQTVCLYFLRMNGHQRRALGAGKALRSSTSPHSR